MPHVDRVLLLRTTTAPRALARVVTTVIAKGGDVVSLTYERLPDGDDAVLRLRVGGGGDQLPKQLKRLVDVLDVVMSDPTGGVGQSH